MKALLLLLLLHFVTAFCFVPLAFSSRLLTSSSDVVVDVEGNEVKLGEPYYAISKGVIHLEGLCLRDIKNETTSGCPHDVIQCTIFDQPLVGLPIIFSNSSSAGSLTADSGGGNSTTDAFVLEDTFYTVKFAVKEDSSSCAKETTWGLGEGNDTNSKIVTTDPAASAVEFQLSREGSEYKMSYCVIIPLPRVSFCYDIGLIEDGEYSRLGVGLGINAVPFFFATKGTRVEKHAAS